MTTSQKISAWVQYIYFLRFSILSWFFLPTLVLLDHFGYSTAITRAFMAPDSPWQAFHIAFFVVSLQMAVLVTARNSCMNGADRFDSPPPPSLSWLFASSKPEAVWWSLALSHIPTLITLIYVAYIAWIEGETAFPFFHYHSSGLIWLYFVIGILAAVIFWYAVSLFYHWTYSEQPVNDCELKGAKPLIFPQKFFGDLDHATRPMLGHILERPLRALARITYPGFAQGPGEPLWELHFLAFVSLVGFLLLYFFLYPLTSPIPREGPLRVGKIIACILALLFIAGVVYPPNRGCSKWATPVKWFFVAVAVTLAAVFCWSASAFLRWTGTERHLPVLASIVILWTFMLWVFAGLAFLLDRYRVPVFTALMVIVFFPKFMHWTYGEHYFLAQERTSTNIGVIPPSPDQALKLRSHDPNDPLVIITATGGGIHAAAWTTEILGRLEQSFAGDPSLHAPFPGAPAYRFHDHVLLASGVSGGSVGLMSYLLEYSAEKPFDPEHLPAATARMTNAAACSSIEDVAWGLEYYDFVRLFFNVWYSFDHVAPDRNWALSKAFNRNLHHPLCRTDDQSLTGLSPLTLNGEDLTLSKGAELLQKDKLPAFTLNTTAVETGGRFLLSNYQIPRNYNPQSDLLPSESFLQAYGEPCAASEEHQGYRYADLPIATAARLSATFPFVSSASRVPAQFAPYAYHFVDGGYYDNDGTGSAIEFLSSALTKPVAGGKQDPCFPSSSPGKAQAAPLAILLIEIRNGDDLDPLSNEDDYHSQTHPQDKHAWTAISQLTAPPGALWKAGHESVTRRNRLGLCLLESSYPDQLVVHHVVIDYGSAQPNTDVKKPTVEIEPLNWHLTAGERKEIADRASDKATDAAIENARNWVRTRLNPEPVGIKDEPCRIAYVRTKP